MKLWRYSIQFIEWISLRKKLSFSSKLIKLWSWPIHFIVSFHFMIYQIFKYFTSFSRVNQFEKSLRFSSKHFELWKVERNQFVSNTASQAIQTMKQSKWLSRQNQFRKKFNFSNKLWEFQKLWNNSSLFIDWIKSSTVWIFLSKLFDKWNFEVNQFILKTESVCERVENFKQATSDVKISIFFRLLHRLNWFPFFSCKLLKLQKTEKNQIFLYTESVREKY